MVDATFALERVAAGLDGISAWVTITTDGVRIPWAGKAIADPDEYEDGWKEARLLHVDDIVVQASELGGGLQVSRLVFELSDVPDPVTGRTVLRRWLGLGHAIRGCEIDAKIITDTQRRAGDTPRVLFRGIVRRFSGDGGFRARLECVGYLQPRLGQKVIQERVGDSWSGASAEFASLPAPVAIGRLSDAGSATGTSPDPAAEAASGATGAVDGQAAAGYGSLGGSPPTGVALAEEAAGDFVPGDELFVQVWKEVAGVAGDPDAGSYPFGAMGVGITIGGSGASVRATCTDDSDGATYCFAIGVFFFGYVRYHQILRTTTPATGVVFTRAPGAAGIDPQAQTDITPGATFASFTPFLYALTYTFADGESSIANAWLAFVGPYARPPRIVADPPPVGVVAATVYRANDIVFSASKLDRKREVPLTNLNGDGNLYFDDDLIDANWTRSSPPVARGKILPIPVGPLQDLEGFVWPFVATYAAHACKVDASVVAFIEEEDPDTGETISRQVDGVTHAYGIDILVPGQAGYSTAFGAPTYYTTPNGRRHMIVAARGPLADELAAGTKKIRLNVLGLETVGDGSGTLLTAFLDVLKHLAINHRLLSDTSALGGDWRTAAPTFADGASKLDEASFTLAATNLAAVLPLGVDVARHLVEDLTWDALFAQLLPCAAARALTNAEGALQVVIPNRAQAPAAAIDSRREVIRGSFTWRGDDTSFVNAQAYQYDTRYEEPGVAPEAAVTVAPLELVASQVKYVERAEGAARDLSWVPAAAQAAAVVALLLTYTATLPILATLGSSIHWTNFKVGDVLLVTHPSGPSVTGWNNRPVWIASLSIGASALEVLANVQPFPPEAVEIVVADIEIEYSDMDQDITLHADIASNGDPVDEGEIAFEVVDDAEAELAPGGEDEIESGVAELPFTVPGGTGA